MMENRAIFGGGWVKPFSLDRRDEGGHQSWTCKAQANARMAFSLDPEREKKSGDFLAKEGICLNELRCHNVSMGDLRPASVLCAPGDGALVPSPHAMTHQEHQRHQRSKAVQKEKVGVTIRPS